MAVKDKKEPGALRQRLEALRDDCRRHPEQPVPLERFEGPLGEGSALQLACERGVIKPVARSGWQSSPGRSTSLVLGLDHKTPEARAQALLARLGALAKDSRLTSNPRGQEWEIGAVLVLDRVRATEARVQLEWPQGTRTLSAEQFAGELATLAHAVTRRWTVPDVLAAIAELCESMLTSGAPRTRKQHDAFSLMAHALQLLNRARELGHSRSDREIAADLGVNTSTFSRCIGRTKPWKAARALEVRDRRPND